MSDASKPTDWEVVQTMEQLGGSFIQALAVCCHRADPQNFTKIKAAFSDEWASYVELTKLRKERHATQG